MVFYAWMGKFGMMHYTRRSRIGGGKRVIWLRLGPKGLELLCLQLPTDNGDASEARSTQVFNETGFKPERRIKKTLFFAVIS